MNLKLEINNSFCEDGDVQKLATLGVLISSPNIGDEDHWLFRVDVGHGQAVIGFPKLGLIGIGFQKEEEDWNTNLPSACDMEAIYAHIEVNKGDGPTPDDCKQAIVMIQEAVERYESTRG